MLTNPLDVVRRFGEREFCGGGTGEAGAEFIEAEAALSLKRLPLGQQVHVAKLSVDWHYEYLL